MGCWMIAERTACGCGCGDSSVNGKPNLTCATYKSVPLSCSNQHYHTDCGKRIEELYQTCTSRVPNLGGVDWAELSRVRRWPGGNPAAAPSAGRADPAGLPCVSHHERCQPLCSWCLLPRAAAGTTQCVLFNWLYLWSVQYEVQSSATGILAHFLPCC